MGTQKPGEWANLVLARFEDQVRDWRCPDASGVDLLASVSWSFRFVCSPSPSPSRSLSPSRSRHPLPVCGHLLLLLLPLMSHPRCIYGTRPTLLVDSSSTPFMGASWGPHRYRRPRSRRNSCAPCSPGIGFRVLSPLVAVHGAVDFSRPNALVSGTTARTIDATDSRSYPRVG